MAKKLGDAATEIATLLETFTSDERLRILQASLTLLGEKATIREDSLPPNGHSTTASGPSHNDASTSNLPATAQKWAERNGISLEMLEAYFHIEGNTVSVIAIPDSVQGKKDRTVAAYLFNGIANLLASGEPSFTDETARKLCRDLGCYDSPNHAASVKTFGNRFTGSKNSGWKLTAPGLTAAADLLKG